MADTGEFVPGELLQYIPIDRATYLPVDSAQTFCIRYRRFNPRRKACKWVKGDLFLSLH